MKEYQIAHPVPFKDKKIEGETVEEARRRLEEELKKDYDWLFPRVMCGLSMFVLIKP